MAAQGPHQPVRLPAVFSSIYATQTLPMGLKKGSLLLPCAWLKYYIKEALTIAAAACARKCGVT